MIWVVRQGSSTKLNGYGFFVASGQNGYHFISHSLQVKLHGSTKATVGFGWWIKGNIFRFRTQTTSGC